MLLNHLFGRRGAFRVKREEYPEKKKKKKKRKDGRVNS